MIDEREIQGITYLYVYGLFGIYGFGKSDVEYVFVASADIPACAVF